MKRRSALPVAAGFIALAMTMASCSGSTENGASGEGDPVSGGTFRHAVFPEVGSIIPMSANQPQEIQVITYAYESLIYTDESGERLPWLAESWEVNEDGTAVTFQLKEGVTFHDGTEFDAEIAAENINYHTDPDNVSVLSDVLPAGLSATGSGLTLEVTAGQPDPFLASIIGNIRMVGSAGLADPRVSKRHRTAPVCMRSRALRQAATPSRPVTTTPGVRTDSPRRPRGFPTVSRSPWSPMRRRGRTC
ncbi:hypothetical protein KAE78_02840 [Microbacterium sp. NIBRBAC000506063]|nr:hypothetical protein KAE78_02840 [Microbacterium sp. NIBRBAC000506063]